MDELPKDEPVWGPGMVSGPPLPLADEAILRLGVHPLVRCRACGHEVRLCLGVPPAKGRWDCVNGVGQWVPHNPPLPVEWFFTERHMPDGTPNRSTWPFAAGCCRGTSFWLADPRRA